MKTKLVMLALMVCSSWVFSQEIETFTSNPDKQSTTIGGFGGPILQVSQINMDWGLVFGGKGGVIINRKWAFGGIGKGLTKSLNFLGDDLNDNKNASLDLNFRAGGLFLEYLINLEKPIHFSIPINLMAGEVYIEDATLVDSEIEASGIFMIEPGINVEFNISKFFIAGINLSYRQVLGSSLINLSNQDISGANIGLIFKFGSF